MNFEKSLQPSVRQGRIKDIQKSQKETYEDKKDSLEYAKEILENRFGKEKLPKDLVLEMVSIRRQISEEIKHTNFVPNIDAIDDRIKNLVAKISIPKMPEGAVKSVSENEDGILELEHFDGHKEKLGENETELLGSLRLYFESYRMAINANKFRENLSSTKEHIVKENASRKINFYSESEKKEEVVADIYNKYSDAGFSKEDIKDMIEFCDIEDVNNLPIHKIQMMKKIKDVFDEYFKGSKTEYVALSAALLVPAIIDGYAPKFFSEAFKGDKIDLNQIVLYVVASLSSIGLSLALQKKYNNFMNGNFSKEGGVSDYVSKNLAGFSGSEKNNFNTETVKKRVDRGKNSYQRVFDLVSYNVLPASAGIITSAVVLYEKNPILAAGTATASALTIVLDKYFQKKFKFMEKERGAERESENISTKINEQLNAHMEIILAGEKERFMKEMKEFLDKEKIAGDNRSYFEAAEQSFYQAISTSSLVVSALATSLAGGGASNFVTSFMYSGQLTHSFHRLLSSKRKILANVRNMLQMEVMFNGYADEETEAEKSRISADRIKNGDINVKDLNVSFHDKKILNNINLNIPSGSMVNLEGASGAGKTTLMKVLAGYYTPTTGEVHFGGENVANIKKAGEDSIYNKIAYLSQFPYLFEDSIKNNVTFGIQKNVEDFDIKEVLNEVGLGKRFSDLNEKLFSGSGDSSKASGGETSRLGLARALLKIRNGDSKLVFLDEPTASVDRETKKVIAEIINKEKEKRPDATFIVISHDGEFVERLNCDITVKMSHGKIIEKEK